MGQSLVPTLSAFETNAEGSRVVPLGQRWPHSPRSELKPLCLVSPNDGLRPTRASRLHPSPAAPTPTPHWSGDSFEEAKNCFIFRH